MQATQQDAIEDSIDINATAEQVWPLVSEPGWWINEGSYREHLIEEREGFVLVTDPGHGVFPIATVDVRQPRSIAFRRMNRTDDPTPDAPGTLTEFWIEDRPDGVTLRVRESGFYISGSCRPPGWSTPDGPDARCSTPYAPMGCGSRRTG